MRLPNYKKFLEPNVEKTFKETVVIMQVKFNLSDNFIKIKNLNYFFCWKI